MNSANVRAALLARCDPGERIVPRVALSDVVVVSLRIETSKRNVRILDGAEWNRIAGNGIKISAVYYVSIF